MRAMLSDAHTFIGAEVSDDGKAILITGGQNVMWLSGNAAIVLARWLLDTFSDPDA